MKISDKVLKLANAQINLEEYSSRAYLMLATWCGSNDYRAAQAYYMSRSMEELTHRNKIIEFLLDCGYDPVFMPIQNDSSAKPKELEDTVTIALGHEQAVSKAILDIMQAADEDSEDCNSESFFMWFVNEQREEEATYIDILSFIDKIGLNSDAPNWAKGMMRIELEERIAGA
jgi:ferritin